MELKVFIGKYIKFIVSHGCYYIMRASYGLTAVLANHLPLTENLL